ncbi:hypothetical protein [Sciscionella sediminilitoris]|uniref:hypothetical protein n=1 Tax=Sciscionella sediminilitoris TaxID=1445613 RepID=UPI0004DEEDD6|nr:hypothetical protein [Sciscionella sp. SE31]
MRAKTIRGAHLLILLASLALAGYTASFVLGDPLALIMLVWFLGAVIGHDLILFPIYALADRATSLLANIAPVSPLNYVRVPVLGSALTFVLFFPGIIEQGAPTYQAATGQTQEPYLVRWLILAGVLFATSGLCYAIRLYRSRVGGSVG